MTQNLQPTDPDVFNALEEIYLRIKPPMSARRLWDRVLTAAERQQLGGDLEAAFGNYGTLGMWRKLRGVEQNRAILDVAHALGLLSDTDFRWLLRGIGETAESGMPDRPNLIEGELFFRNKVIRQIRRNKFPSNVQVILAAFQAANWAPKIANPLEDPLQLGQTLRTLKRNLKQISFHSLEGSNSVSWQPKSH